jgi:competence protein ComEC
VVHPAAIPALALAAGTASGIFLPHSSRLDSAAFVLCFLGASAAFVRRCDRAATAFLAAGYVAGGVLLGAQTSAAALKTPIGTLFDRAADPQAHQLFAIVEGHLRSDASQGPSGVSLGIEVDRLELNRESHATSGGIIVGVGGELGRDQISQWRAGRRVRLPATLRRPARYLNPGVPDPQRQFAWRGTTLVGSVKSDALVEVIAHGSSWQEVVASIRAAVRRSLASSVAPWSRRSAAVVAAILIGDRAGLDDDVERRLQEAGTYHVIAISGGNIAILAGLCLCLLRALRVGPRLSAVLLIAILTGYAMVVEGGSSVGRATLMAVIYFAAQIWDYRTRPVNVSALTAAILLCAGPLQVVDAGFALTFGATLGILIGLSRMSDRFAIPWYLQPPVALFAASVCAEIALLPVSAFVFSRVTAAGLIVNFAAIPLMTVVQIAGMAAVALASWGSSVAAGAGWIAHWAVEGLIGSTSIIDIIPWLTRRVPPPSLIIVAIYYIAVVAALRSSGSIDVVPTLWLQPRLRQTAVAGSATAVRLSRRSTTSFRSSTVVAIACGWWIVEAPGVAQTGATRLLRVTVLDVGQGDAAIVQFPDGRTVSIDAGGLAGATFDIGSRVVTPAFWAAGVRRLDYMSISHSDRDHIGGAASVFRDLRPFEVWEGVPVPPDESTQQLRQLVNAAGGVWRTLQPDDQASFGDVELYVRHPPRPDWERQRVRNDDSEVLEIRYGGVSFVFAGDIGRDVEREIASSFAWVPIRILKVPHHGSEIGHAA